MTLLSVDEHRELFTNGGYSNVQVIEERGKGWICGARQKTDGQLLIASQIAKLPRTTR